MKFSLGESQSTERCFFVSPLHTLFHIKSNSKSESSFKVHDLFWGAHVSRLTEYYRFYTLLINYF